MKDEVPEVNVEDQEELDVEDSEEVIEENGNTMATFLKVQVQGGQW